MPSKIRGLAVHAAGIVSEWLPPRQSFALRRAYTHTRTHTQQQQQTLRTCKIFTPPPGAAGNSLGGRKGNARQEDPPSRAHVIRLSVCSSLFSPLSHPPPLPNPNPPLVSLNKRMYKRVLPSRLLPNFPSPQVLLSAAVFIKTHSAEV